MSTALVISDSINTALARLLSEVGTVQVPLARTLGEARAALSKTSVDLVIINEGEEGNGVMLAETLAGEYSSSVVLLSREMSFPVADGLRSRGVLPVSKPTSPEALASYLKYILAMRGSLSRVTAENRKLKEELEETKVVNRAKLLLVQYLGMTESEAHRTIEKKAMDGRVTRLSVAREIIKIYAS